jgi:hypothetical protein
MRERERAEFTKNFIWRNKKEREREKGKSATHSSGTQKRGELNGNY